MRITVDIPNEALYPRTENFIQQIKAIRAITGCSLRAAKAAIDVYRVFDSGQDVEGLARMIAHLLVMMETKK